MDGISGVAARVCEVQAAIASVSGAGTTTSASAATTAAASSTSGTSFETALRDAMSTTDAGTAAAPAPSGRLNANGVPTDLARYGNGKIPASALRTIGGTNHRLWAPASTAFESLRAAAQRDGVHIGITDSYRSYAQQVDLARRKGLYSQGGLAAVPGTSNHGWGRSVDLSLDAKAQAWMRANAHRFGFTNDVSRESWHWTYTPA